MAETFEPLLEQGYTQLEHKIRAAGTKVDFARIRAAFELAARSHAGQQRKDGTPYVTHCIAAAEITVDMGLDEDSIVCALLHDTIEDTGVTHEQIARQFGPVVADIVEGVTKLTRVNYTSREDEQMENMRKMLLAMSRDIRVILIKLADRLHNMRTMDYQTPEKQRLKSLETMEIYAPIAHRLGIQAVKWELEDLSLKYLDPVAFQSITTSIEERRGNLDDFMSRMENKIRARLREWGISCTIYHRIKHTYSIYRKMYTQKLELSEIWDICALRVIVDTLQDCYSVLGLVHEMFNTVPGKFKDYISMPKPNGYQSLHTTVIGSEAIPFEVQIRTWEMHRTAEYGVAAHWKYKSSKAGIRDGDEKKFAWVRRLLETQQETEADDFISGLKVDMFADEVFVFSPKGDVTCLPAGATPVDFAYSVHSAVGNRMVGAKINGRIVPYSQELQNGDMVEILTSKSAPGPSRDWLKLAKSGSARTKIKQWLKKERREENIVQGREMLEAEFRRAGVTMAEINEYELLPPLLKRQSYVSVDDLYAAIGYGGMTAAKVANRLRDELLRAQRSAGATGRTALDKMKDAAERRNQKDPARPRPINGVLIAGLDNCLLKFARCCTPVAGDEIVGFITRGYGVSIHRTDCKNHIVSRVNPDGEGRWVDATWDMSAAESYITTLHISSYDRNALVMDISTVLNGMNAKVRSFNARDVGAGMASTTLNVEVRNLDELKAIMARLATIQGVKQVSRGNG
ncbi:MAG: bifunctional (p)ppGpp synthetase/guanosine-3',5'-bis(diphosphate) 3'-pyrophosphohydrolase [Oscillospiraceae bacterium]|nr:bifunctional (p)ppGpp synthetase/guanosine-3',5'-bis(diphosphate) 3'-pyrophosphohydrolase [Oscillospiraceae bacterium]MBR3084442.1 bifunctional (p)ppGpp synthetase/guanosine-3',5'-bis(diphosphate) 3'-pyrophosphohydrolase [Oscillospiraceae bacterium]